MRPDVSPASIDQWWHTSALVKSQPKFEVIMLFYKCAMQSEIFQPYVLGFGAAADICARKNRLQAQLALEKIPPRAIERRLRVQERMSLVKRVVVIYLPEHVFDKRKIGALEPQRRIGVEQKS